MTTEQKKKIKKQLSFETWRDRAFSIIIPGVLIYVLVSNGHSQQLKLIALIILAGFATGQAASLIKIIANSFAEGIIKSNGQDDGTKNSNSANNSSRGSDVDPK